MKTTQELLQRVLDGLESCEVVEGYSEWERNFDPDKVTEAVKEVLFN